MVSESSAHWNSFSFRRSSGVATGALEKKWTHPPSAQLRTTKPLASRLDSSRGRSLSRTKYSSSYESYIIGTPSAYTDLTSCARSEEHTSELQSRLHLVCRLLLEKKKTK